jgi:GNAT superfamily N-acetyltransferase
MGSRSSTRIMLDLATPEDGLEIAALRTAVAEQLTREFGQGHWSSCPTERSVLNDLRTSHVYVAREDDRIMATLRLATRKPWAIDLSYFTECVRPLYLSDMAVAPEQQRRGIGRQCLTDVNRIAREWTADAIRLDAYDAPAGAGEFYAKCGFREVGRVTYRKTPLIYFELRL